MVRLESDYSMIELEFNTAMADIKEEKEKSYNEGIKQGETSMIKTLIENGMSKEMLAKSLNKNISEIDDILNYKS